MLLSTSLSISNILSHLSDAEKIVLYQEAYSSVIQKIRLNVGLFPVLMDKAFKTDKLNSLHTIVTSGSEIAFKSLEQFVKCNLQQTIESTDYTLTGAVIGNISETDFGYDSDDFLAINEDHETAPELYVNGTDIICTNMDSAFFNVLGYRYPYPVRYSSDTEYNTEYRYDIQWMIDTYGIENIEIDDLLCWFIILKTLSLFHMENGDPGESKLFNDYLMEVINLYNTNDNLFKHSKPTIHGGLNVSK